MLHIRQSKFRKSRLVPLTPSVLEALERYAQLRDRLRPAPTGESFFVSLRGTRVIHACVWKTFRALCDRAGIGAGSNVRPTIHDLRHNADGGVMRPAGLFGLVRALPVVILSA